MKTITCQDPLPERRTPKWIKTKDGQYREGCSDDIIKVKCVCGHCGDEE